MCGYCTDPLSPPCTSERGEDEKVILMLERFVFKAVPGDDDCSGVATSLSPLQHGHCYPCGYHPSQMLTVTPVTCSLSPLSHAHCHPCHLLNVTLVTFSLAHCHPCHTLTITIVTWSLSSCHTLTVTLSHSLSPCHTLTVTFSDVGARCHWQVSGGRSLTRRANSLCSESLWGSYYKQS